MDTFADRVSEHAFIHAQVFHVSSILCFTLSLVSFATCSEHSQVNHFN